jgi:hypothetical protein
MLVYPLVEGRELGWPTWSLVLLGAAVPVLAGFTWYQRRRSRSGATPLIEMRVFTKRSYTSGVLFVVVFFGAVVGFSLAVGLFLRIGLRYTPLAASLAMSAWAIGAFLGAAFGSTMTNKLGRNILHLGLGLMGGGLAGLYIGFATAGAGLTGLNLVVPLLLFGIGMGMIFAPLFDIILAAWKTTRSARPPACWSRFNRSALRSGSRYSVPSSSVASAPRPTRTTTWTPPCLLRC